MKRFLIGTGVFFLCFLLLTYVVYYLEIYTYLLPSREVYEAIKESKQKDSKVTTLIIGDSVGKQLFNGFYDKKDTIESLASNQAIDLIGQYLLLKNFLDANTGVERVYMVYNPFSFNNNLDHKFTYNYFLKPFYKPEYLPFFSQEALSQIQKIPFYKIANFPPVAITFWTPEVQENEDKNIFLSEISIEYLKKMKYLTDSKNISFQIVPPPVKTSRKQEIEMLYKTAEKEEHPELLTGLFNHYFNKLFYLPDSLYVDGMHFKDPEKFTTLVVKKSF